MRILHFSDLHLGVEPHGRVDPSTGLHTRVRDFVRSLGFLCSEASKAKSLCSEATQHGITNGEACSKAQGTLNTLAHGLAKLSGPSRFCR